MKALLLAAILAGPAAADPLIDDALLLEQYADKITSTTTEDGQLVQELDLGDGITFTCRDGTCEGRDEGGENGGPTGCLWDLMMKMRDLDDLCDIASDSDSARIRDLATRLTAHVAENALPPRPVAELEAESQGRLDAWKTLGDKDRAQFCEWLIPQMRYEPQEYVDVFTSDEAVEGIDRLLSKPRLPVMLPCPRIF